jgi:transposase
MSFTSDTILVALELSNSLWLVGTRQAGARSSQMHRVSAGDTATLMHLLDGLQASGREQGHPCRRLQFASRQDVMDFGCTVC